MKKTFLTIAIILGISFCGFAQDKGLFGLGPQRGGNIDEFSSDRDPSEPMFNLPGSHGYDGDVQAPIGSGALLLIGFGAAYAIGKKNRK